MSCIKLKYFPYYIFSIEIVLKILLIYNFSKPKVSSHNIIKLEFNQGRILITIQISNFWENHFLQRKYSFNYLKPNLQ